MNTVQAIYENGVFRPMDPVDLPEHVVVEFEPRIQKAGSKSETVAPGPMSEGLARIYAILGERYASGHGDTAARHNEHQP